ncbi:Hypothetical protein CINCED_3A022938 [Cinara cedri]|uniref:Uncharacterized protein n=1 Tax=Cinara cedri TaxID=506608 RepID=A0A5E4NFN7_9HEMI|nr:Hypothetical protein CINCED_3A022938 [Cinara cedri]
MLRCPFNLSALFSQVNRLHTFDLQTVIPAVLILVLKFRPRRQGRPRSRWIDETKKDLQLMGISEHWRSVAEDRDECRRIVSEAKGHHGLGIEVMRREIRS